MSQLCLEGHNACRARCGCWSGHLFASNVGVLPTVPDGCTLNPKIILSIPKRSLGRKLKRRRRRLFRALRRCDVNVTSIAPTAHACVQRR